MKFLFIILLGIALYGNSLESYGWDTTAAKYMPLQVGNVWVYRTYISASMWTCYAYEKYSISNTININGSIFYEINKILKLYNPICSTRSFPILSRIYKYNFLRIDSASMNLRSEDSCIVDSLLAEEGDTTKVCTFFYSPVYCDTSTQAILGYQRPAKRFLWGNFEASEEVLYIKDFGFVRYHLSQPGPYSEDMLLTGCVINGIVYGDTNTMVGINQLSNEVPKDFSLSQNYPNPFNPATRFGFRIADFGLVRVTVYDALGKEVQVLVNQNLSPGTYEVDFDGSDLPSGVYYYRLDASTPLSAIYTETKKMVLIK